MEKGTFAVIEDLNNRARNLAVIFTVKTRETDQGDLVVAQIGEQTHAFLVKGEKCGAVNLKQVELYHADMLNLNI